MPEFPGTSKHSHTNESDRSDEYDHSTGTAYRTGERESIQATADDVRRLEQRLGQPTVRREALRIECP
jgi:hypothetical protein